MRWLTLATASLWLLAAGAHAQAVRVLQNGATASGNGALLSTSGMATAVLTVNCASCSGGTTVNFEGTADGTNFAALVAVQSGSALALTSTQAAGVTVWSLNVAGFQAVRARISAYSAGTITVTGFAVVNTASRIPPVPSFVSMAAAENALANFGGL